MKKRLTALTLILILSMVIAAPASAQTGGSDTPTHPLTVIETVDDGKEVYIIQLEANPVVAYEGDISGIPATKPAEGQKINPNNAKVKKYVSYLNKEHDKILKQAGAEKDKVYDYVYAFNGMAAVLSAKQADAIAKMPGVLAVAKDQKRYATTDNSPSFLELNTDGGLWEQLGGVENAGEDVIIGVIDTGIWPEHPSFSDQIDLVDRPGKSGKRTLAYGPPPADWYGSCQSGELWSQDDCNNKLIGARYFLDGYGHHGIIHDDYKSARDADGHGTHTASTAGGNYGVSASISGNDFGMISGMAPRARIAMYKALWNDGGGYSSDLAAAIDQAVADGVDVINYSIGSDTPGLLGPDDIAFLFAADAGVFVATSAGNAGPGYGTIGSPASVPWVMTVGASTQNRTYQGSVVLGSGAEYFGASVMSGTEVLPLVDAEDAGSELCIPGELDPAVVSGKIVLCMRGAVARVDKSQAVYLAGGLGTILYNTFDGDTQNTDTHWTPTVHINYTNGSAVKAYIDAMGAGATAQITAGIYTPITAPDMASFSSRGPDLAAEDIIKPDVTAPGVNILAGSTPTPLLGPGDNLFAFLGGTSMSSPHVAGLGALLVQMHPDWSPAMVKSALMTTAYTEVMKEDGVTPADPFDIGAGHVRPNTAVDPGLVYDAGWNDYLAFFCGAGVADQIFADPQGTCGRLESFGYSIDPSDLNLPSIGIAQLTGYQTVTRYVTNVGDPATYTVAVEAPAGIDVVVNPASLTLGSGETAAYQVTFTSLPEAEMDQWVFGALTWSDGVHAVRSPLAIRPSAIAAPAEVKGTGTSGSLTFDVTFGYNGDYLAMAHGLEPANMINATVVDDPANDINTALTTGDGINIHMVDIPAGAAYARFSLFDEYTDGADDLDLYVFDPEGYQVGGSGSGTSAEEVNLSFPDPGSYFVVVHGWQTDGADANYTLFTWAFGADTGNMTLSAPTTAALAATEPVTVDWAGLDAGTKYLGAVSHNNPTDNVMYGLTVIRVDTD